MNRLCSKPARPAGARTPCDVSATATQPPTELKTRGTRNASGRGLVGCEYWVREDGVSPQGSQAADVGEALELLREVVFVQNRVCAVLHHLQGHHAKV